MLQEILTYMIIGSAVTLAILKIGKRLGRKRKRKKTTLKKDSFASKHNCSDCAAECMLRDVASPIIQKNKNLCSTTQNMSKEPI